MLHRSFKPAKCKTALKLAASRIKLLKNKREAQVKQLKRELAQLLQSGQDRTAMIRVEHVVREEKTLSAYELIEIYCELIVARLPIIESQKNCPIDLKEAIASVVFASPRCADVPELGDVRKHFTAKYGKEFISAAVELRPDCGVGRMLIEKLSVKAPDGQAKIKILKSIAEEHNIKWDPSAVNDPKPPEDLLNGPSTFDKASQMHMGHPNIQARPDFDGRGQSTSHIPSSYGEKFDIPANLYDHNKSSEQYTQSDAHTNIATNRATFSGPSRPETRHSGNGYQGVEVRHSYSGNGRDMSSGRQNWNMEFKDAAEAAQAAAESADRASMAARAAAELSGHANVTRLNHSGSHGSYGLRGDPPDRYSSSNFEDQHVGKDQAAGASRGRVPKAQSEQINETDQDNMTGGVDERFYKHDNWSSNKLNQAQGSSSDYHHTVNSSQVADMYSENNSSRYVGKDQAASSFHGRVRKVQSGQMNETEQDNMSGGVDERFYKHENWSSNKLNQTSSLKSQGSSSDDCHRVNSSQMADMYSENNSSRPGRSDFIAQMSSDKPSSKAGFESVSEDQTDMKSEYIDYPEEIQIRKQSSRTSRSHSGTFGNDHAVVMDPDNDASKNPFAVVNEGSFENDTNHTSSHDKAPLVFDDSGSDEDVFGALSSKGQESSLFFSAPGRRSPTHLPTNMNVWSPGQNVSHPVFSESHPIAPQSHDVLPAFDDSDDPSSESEEDAEESKHVGNMISISRRKAPFVEKEPESDRKLLSQSFSNDESGSKFQEKSSVNDFTSKRKQSLVPDDYDSHLSDDPVVEGISSSEQLSRPLSVHGPQVFVTGRDTEAVKESSLESGSELNLGQLTGGFRNKGYRHPPYNRNPSGNAFLSPRSVAQSSFPRRVDTTVGSGSNWQESYNQNTRTKANEKPSSRASGAHFDDEDMSIGVNQMSSSRSPPTYFDSDNSDSEENHPKQTATSKPRLVTGLSRRTKAYPEHSDRHSPKKATVLSRKETTLDLDAEMTETLTEPHFEAKSSFHMGDLDWARKVAEPASKPSTDSNRRYQRSFAEPVSKPVLYSNRPSSEERKVVEEVSKPIPDSKRRSPVERKVAEPVSKPVLDSNRSSPRERKVAEAKPIPDSNRPSLSSNMSGLNAAGSQSKGKPSHVHPKLPDIDSITAHLQSLRNNRG